MCSVDILLMLVLDETHTKGNQDAPIGLTPSQGPSGTSMSTKTPGRDFEDRWSLDMDPDVRSW